MSPSVSRVEGKTRNEILCLLKRMCVCRSAFRTCPFSAGNGKVGICVDPASIQFTARHERPLRRSLFGVANGDFGPVGAPPAPTDSYLKPLFAQPFQERHLPRYPDSGRYSPILNAQVVAARL